MDGRKWMCERCYFGKSAHLEISMPRPGIMLVHRAGLHVRFASNLQKRLLCGYQVAQWAVRRAREARPRQPVARGARPRQPTAGLRAKREARSAVAAKYLKLKRTTRNQANGIEIPKIFRRARFSRAALRARA
jgi:hypothetical protein